MSQPSIGCQDSSIVSQQKLGRGWTTRDTSTVTTVRIKPWLILISATGCSEWMNPKKSPASNRRNKLLDSHTTVCSTAMKMINLQLHATIWRNLSNTLLNEESQTQKSTICITHTHTHTHTHTQRERKTGKLIYAPRSQESNSPPSG